MDGHHFEYNFCFRYGFVSFSYIKFTLMTTHDLVDSAKFTRDEQTMDSQNHGWVFHANVPISTKVVYRFKKKMLFLSSYKCWLLVVWQTLSENKDQSLINMSFRDFSFSHARIL